MESAHQQALAILNENRELLEKISQKILDTEVIEGDLLQELLAEVKTPEAVEAIT